MNARNETPKPEYDEVVRALEALLKAALATGGTASIPWLEIERAESVLLRARTLK